jgi:hypothetical protein
VKVPLTDIHSDLDDIVKALSDTTRQIVFGILAFVWVFLAGGSSSPSFRLTQTNRPLLGIAAFCIASLLLGLAQSLCAYFSSLKVLRDAEDANAEEAEYDESDWRRRLQFVFFYAKLTAAAIGGTWLIALFVIAVT